ncbi:hypothetical protein PFISCL1PPCAC_18486, partial [Pristionchus fissidentatus]
AARQHSNSSPNCLPFLYRLEVWPRIISQVFERPQIPAIMGQSASNTTMPTQNADYPKPYLDLLFKLVLVGDSNSDKMGILNRFCDETVDPFVITMDIDFKIKTIEMCGLKIKLQIWDTTSQERYRTITTLYCRGAHGIILVYDITSADSFDKMKTYMKDISENAFVDGVKILLANKCEMEYKRVVSKERGKKVASENNMSFLEVSSKENINIEKAFYTLVEDILNNVL